jgi:tRNA/rRNA methyltransferase
MPFTVVLVKPEYEENLGLVARAMKNFGLKDLRLVAPNAKPNSGKAKSRAMHAQDLLNRCRVYESIEEALAGVEVAVATTAITTPQKNIYRSPLSPAELFEKYAQSQARVALVFGPEPSGLTNEQIKACDLVLTVPCSQAYPTMNLAQCAAVVFYEVFKHAASSDKHKTAGKNIRQQLLKSFQELIEASPRIKNKENTLLAFKSLLAKSPLTEKEAKAVLSALKEGQSPAAKK